MSASNVRQYSFATRQLHADDSKASELLPLWEVMKVLADSDTPAQAEIDATVREVNDTLTHTTPSYHSYETYREGCLCF